MNALYRGISSVFIACGLLSVSGCSEPKPDRTDTKTLGWYMKISLISFEPAGNFTVPAAPIGLGIASHSWSGKCKIKLTIKITYPPIIDIEGLPRREKIVQGTLPCKKQTADELLGISDVNYFCREEIEVEQWLRANGTIYRERYKERHRNEKMDRENLLGKFSRSDLDKYCKDPRKLSWP